MNPLQELQESLRKAQAASLLGLTEDALKRDNLLQKYTDKLVVLGISIGPIEINGNDDGIEIIVGKESLKDNETLKSLFQEAGIENPQWSEETITAGAATGNSLVIKTNFQVN